MTLPFARIYGPAVPLVIPAPSGLALVPQTSGGTLAAGTYAYRVTAIYSANETLPAGEVSTTTTGSTGSVIVSWTPVPGATSYKVYGRTTGAEQLIATVTAATYTDTGSVTPAGALPSTTTFTETITTPGLYVCPAGKTALIKQVKVSNPTSLVGQFFLAIVTSAGVGAEGIAAHRIISGVAVQPDAAAINGQPYKEDCFHVLAPGDYLTGYVSAPGLVVTIDGVVS